LGYQFYYGLLNNPATRHGRLFMLFINFFIVISMITFSIATLPNLSEQSNTILNYIEVFIVSIFSAEYLARVIFAKQKFRFIFSFYGVIDLLSIAPFYFFLFTGLDVRVLKVMRLFRILRLFKLFRYSKSITRLKIAYGFIKEELVLFTAVATILLFVSGVGIYYFEKDAQPEVFQSVFDGLWWGVITLTTVGYGDVIPVTVGGRVFTFLIVIVGLGVVSVPTGLIASGLQQAREKEKLTIEGE